jgi:hypothetical protein
MTTTVTSLPCDHVQSSNVLAASNGGGFKAVVLEPSKEKDTGFTSQKSLTADFGPILHSPGFPSMRKPNRSSSCFSVAICLLLSLLFVFSTIGFYPSPHLVSRSFGFIKGLDSESSTTTKLAVDPTIVPSTATRSSQVQFDKYSLILRGQRIFL